MRVVMMTDGIISQGLLSVKNKGIVYTARKALAYIGFYTGYYYIRYLYREYSSYGISIFLGPERTLKLYLAIFKFRCKYNLFTGGQRTFWAGKSFKDCIYKIMDVNPAYINYEVKGGIVPYIQDGDWDLSKREFTLHETIKGIFVDKIPASETQQYKTMQEAIENKDWNKSRDCRTQEDLDAYFRTLEDIYRELSNGKYRLRSEVDHTYLGRWPRRYPDEILLAIDRNGEYMLESGGTHRLSIAKLLGVQTVPAVIVRKHYQYVKSKKDWLN